MKSVKIKTRDPQPTEFTKDQIIINNETGRLFYKSQKGLHEVVSTFTTPLETSLSAGIDLVELGVISLESLEPLTLKDQSNPVPTNTQVTIGVSDDLYFNTTNTGEIFQITTTHGTCRIGPQNPYSCLFDTNLNKFAFNKRILITGNGYQANISSAVGERLALWTDNFNNGEDAEDSAAILLHTAQAVTEVRGDVRAVSNTFGDGFEGGGNVDAERDLLYGRYVLKAGGGPAGLVLRSPNGNYWRITISNTGELDAVSIDNPYE